MQALAVAVQGLGFGAAMVALQGLLHFVAVEVQKYEQGGNAPTHRKTTRATPNWLPVLPVDEDDTLLFLDLL